MELEALEPGPYVLRLEEVPPDYVPDFIECYVTDAGSMRDDYLRSTDGVAALAFEPADDAHLRACDGATVGEPQLHRVRQ